MTKVKASDRMPKDTLRSLKGVLLLDRKKVKSIPFPDSESFWPLPSFSLNLSATNKGVVLSKSWSCRIYNSRPVSCQGPTLLICSVWALSVSWSAAHNLHFSILLKGIKWTKQNRIKRLCYFLDIFTNRSNSWLSQKQFPLHTRGERGRRSE